MKGTTFSHHMFSTMGPTILCTIICDKYLDKINILQRIIYKIPTNDFEINPIRLEKRYQQLQLIIITAMLDRCSAIGHLSEYPYILHY